MKYIFLSVLISVSLHGMAQNKEEQMIRSILNQQTTEWNNGNLNKFMSGYWNNDSLIFIGRKGPVYGYANALANYKKAYPDTVVMGKLSFEIEMVKKLSSNYYFVIGKWNLHRSIGNAEGVYTLLFKKIDGEWKIIVDHSS